MVVQAAKFAVVALVAGFIGWTVGRGTPASEGVEAASTAPAVAAGLATPSATADAPEDCVCGAERDKLLAAVQQSRRLALTQDITWPENAGDHAPDVVEATLKLALEQCSEGAELESIDCEEPPCIAVVRVGDDGWNDASRIQSCEPWLEKYGEDVALSMKSDICDGERVNKAFLSPVWPLGLTPEISQEHYQKRFGRRVKQHRDATCE